MTDRLREDLTAAAAADYASAVRKLHLASDWIAEYGDNCEPRLSMGVASACNGYTEVVRAINTLLPLRMGGLFAEVIYLLSEDAERKRATLNNLLNGT